jgi:hypothetical protein
VFNELLITAFVIRLTAFFTAFIGEPVVTIDLSKLLPELVFLKTV